MKQLILLRGLPGSGKSTVAEYISFLNKAVICEADRFFIKDGVYQFDRNKLGLAHKWCQSECKNAMTNSQNVIVSNTSTTESEIKPYIQMAEEYGYTVISLVVENRHGGINQHGVPEESLVKMKERFSLKL